MPTISSISTVRALASSLEQSLCRATTSVICLPTDMTGFNAVMGSWKIMEILLPRILSISFSGSASRSLPSMVIVPLLTRAGGWGRMRRMDLAMVVLPAPVSPTRPRVSPRFREKLTPLTAWTMSPSEVYSTTRSLTSMNFCSAMLLPPYFLSFGSMASRRPSPKRLIARTTMAIIMPGKIIICGATPMASLAEEIMAPHSGSSAGMPRPM